MSNEKLFTKGGFLMKKCGCFKLCLLLGGVLILLSLKLSHAANKPIDFRWATLMTIATLDPAQMNSDPTKVVGNNLYDSLVFPDVAKGYVPWMAESWKVSTDGKKYTFYLKKRTPFHDGTEVTAEDVVFSMDRLITLKQSAVGTYFKFIKPGTTRILDKYTVEFNLTEPSPQFMVSLFAFKILNKKLILKNKEKGEYGEFGDYGLKYLMTNDAGSGPFMAVEHKVGNFFKMRRFEEYPFEPWHPNSVDSVTVQTIPEAVTRFTKLKAGELDMGDWTLPTKSLKELQKNEHFFVSEELVDGTWICVMNNKKKPLDDVHVRKAIAHAFNVELVTSQILAGGERARGPLPANMRGGCEDIPYYEYDLEKAKAMLKKSKYSPEELKKFEIELAGGISERFDKIMLMLNSDLKKIGFNPTITTTTWPVSCQRAQRPETAFHLALITSAAVLPHPLRILTYYTKDAWGISYPAGGMYYSNPKVEDAIKTANDSSSIEELRKYYCIAQKLIAEDSPSVFSHTDFRLLPMWRYIKGYKYPVGCEYFNLRFNRFTMDTEDPMFKKNHGW
ncbi:MAG: hypothetical protein A2169_02985 [Deltaproteobacteria bacterium RBG_13_47_9]|nr:MAG: hypothetical protein A2169_02985 [Deltaproteobacteria bacterium RBG_13_47_9]